MAKKWTEEDKIWLINNYNNKNAKFCAKKLNRSIQAILIYCNKLGVTNELNILKPKDKIGKLTLIKKTQKGKLSYWLCNCDCGKNKLIRQSSIKSTATKSCGCLQKEKISTHKETKSKLYRVWCRIKNRCLNKKAPEYHRYGGRGIKVYSEWVDSYESFSKYIRINIGVCPDGKTIDRINNNGNYEPGNIKWSSPKEQTRNSSVSKLNKETVKEIKNKLKNRAKQRDISIEYNISIKQIWRIANGKSWGDVK